MMLIGSAHCMLCMCKLMYDRTIELLYKQPAKVMEKAIFAPCISGNLQEIFIRLET